MKGLTGWLTVLGAAGAAMAVAHCGSEEPTQIIVTVEATPNECKVIQKTVVRVGSLDDLAAVAGEKAGCDSATNRIGEFVLVPKAANDAEVQFQVVTGIAKNAEACRSDDRVDCIFAKRVMRYVPHQTIRMNVLMAGACRGKTCEAGETCDEAGQCVSATIAPPTGCQPPESCVDATVVEPPKDAAPDGPLELCEASGCLSLPSAQCRADGVCEVNCGLDQECALACPPGIACVFHCGAANACSTVSCDANAKSCEISCMGQSACNDVECASDACTLACDRKSFQSGTRGCDTVTMSSKNTATVTCAQSGCGILNCVGPGVCSCPSSDPNQCNGGSTLCNNCGGGGSD